MQNLNDLLTKYPRVYPALLNTLIKRGIPVDSAADVLHDFFIKVSDNIKWEEADKQILSFVYKGLALFVINRPHVLRKMHHVHNNKEVYHADLFVEDKDGEEKEMDIEDKYDYFSHYSLLADMRSLLNRNSITGKVQTLVEYYIKALERNAGEEDFRRTTIANSMGVTKEYIRKMSGIIAEHLHVYAEAD